MSTTPIRTPLVCPRQARGPLEKKKASRVAAREGLNGLSPSDQLVNLSGYKVITYRVSIVAEPKNKSGFEKHRAMPLKNSKDVYDLARGIFTALGLDQDREHFVLLCVDQKNKFIGLKVISSGSMTASLVHAREVFHAAIVLRATGVIFVHNHPSGDPAPSPEDKYLTKQLKTVADVMGIRVLDHVIMGDGRYFSFNERGML